VTIDEGLPASIRERFAGREAAVRQAYRDSEPFRAVCRDYLACARALDRWKASRSEEAPLRAHEYAPSCWWSSAGSWRRGCADGSSEWPMPQVAHREKTRPRRPGRCVARSIRAT